VLVPVVHVRPVRVAVLQPRVAVRVGVPERGQLAGVGVPVVAVVVAVAVGVLERLVAELRSAGPTQCGFS